MLINTKHIVMFDEAANDFGRIANMVDDDGSVLIIKDGRPAYAVVSFADVQEADRPASGATPKVETSTAATEPTCGCGKPQSQCGCGGKGGGCGGHGGQGHGHGRHGHEGHQHGGHAHAGPERTGYEHGGAGRGGFGGFGGFGSAAETLFNGGGQHYAEHFGHGSDAGHLHPDAAPEGSENDWDFEFHAGPGFDPLFQGGPNFSVDEFIGRMPPEMVEAGKRFVSQLSPLIGLFGTGTGTATPADDPDKK